MINYYKILGLETYASVSVAKSAYKKLIKIYHPDISDSPDAEEMTRLLNKAKDHVGTALAKEKYDRKLKLAYLREIQRLSGLRTTPTPAAVRPTKTDLQEKIKIAKLNRKRKVKYNYERSLKLLPNPFRNIGIVLLILWSMQLIYSHYFFHYGSFDRTLVILGIGLMFIGMTFAASEVYTKYIIKSLKTNIAFNFEVRIGYTLILGFILSIAAISGLNEYREYYHLKNNYDYALATIDYKASLYGFTVVKYEVDGTMYFKRLDVETNQLIKLNNSRTAVKYAKINPIICEHVTPYQGYLLPRDL